MLNYAPFELTMLKNAGITCQIQWGIVTGSLIEIGITQEENLGVIKGNVKEISPH